MTTVRRLQLESEIPRHWFGGNPLQTHLANALTFVFPAGERFFIRSVRYYNQQINDSHLRLKVRIFAGQEIRHQLSHQQAFLALEQQGYEIQSYLAWYENMAYTIIEPASPPELRLATTAALEHFTSALGEFALATEMLDVVHPAMQALLKWHAAEEIEHRDVAFEVLKQVAPGWGWRFAGFLVALTTLSIFWTAGITHLTKQEKKLFFREGALQVYGFLRRYGPMFSLRLLSYLKPGFHPRQSQCDELAEAYFASVAVQASNSH
jgi:predicted metal-dependent hydrolase